jgi:hypothetical protein
MQEGSGLAPIAAERNPEAGAWTLLQKLHACPVTSVDVLSLGSILHG